MKQVKLVTVTWKDLRAGTQLVQTARKNYVDARKLAISYYKTYKDEKGDFYKIK